MRRYRSRNRLARRNGGKRRNRNWPMSSSSNSSNSSEFQVREFLVREARPEDWPAIAELHVKSWQSAYREILSDAYLDGEAADERARASKTRIAGGWPTGFG